MTTLRAAVTQVAWTGDKETMIKRHEELARSAAASGASIIGFQELFYGPYFGITQDQKYYRYTEPVPGPTVERFQALARELNLVIILPIYEEENERQLLQHGRGHRRRRHAARQVPQAPPPEPRAVLGEVLLPPRQPRLSGVQHRGRQRRRLHLLRPALPRGLARTRAEWRAHRVQPLGDQAGAVQPALGARAASGGRGRNEYFVGANNRVGREDEEFGDEAVDFYGSAVRGPARELRRRRRLD